VYASADEVSPKGAHDREQSNIFYRGMESGSRQVFMAGFAVTAADPSGLWGLPKETFASGRALIEARSSAGANELMKAIVSEMLSSEGRTAAREYVNSRLQGAKSEEIKTRAIETLRQAAAIVDQKAPSDAAAFKEWLLHISTNVA
jgi:hypothetical protein